jgi:hypothetical protein
MATITILVDGKPVEVPARDPIRRGGAATIDGVTLTVAPPLLTGTLEFTEALEKLSDGEMKSSEFGKVRRAFIERTVRRNYPELPQAWFDERDTVDYERLEQALQEASLQGEKPAGNP